MLSSQLEIYDAIVAAQHRRAEVLAIVAESADEAAAAHQVSVALGLSAIAGRAVMDMQLRKLTIEARARFTAERDELFAEVERRRAGQ